MRVRDLNRAHRIESGCHARNKPTSRSASTMYAPPLHDPLPASLQLKPEHHGIPHLRRRRFLYTVPIFHPPSQNGSVVDHPEPTPCLDAGRGRLPPIERGERLGATCGPDRRNARGQRLSRKACLPSTESGLPSKGTANPDYTVRWCCGEGNHMPRLGLFLSDEQGTREPLAPRGSAERASSPIRHFSRGNSNDMIE